MESRILLICAFLCYLLLVVDDIQCEKQNCSTPLRDCPALFNLLKIEKKLPNVSRVDVFDHLKTFLCGFEGKNPLVECPNIAAKGNISLYYYIKSVQKKVHSRHQTCQLSISAILQDLF